MSATLHTLLIRARMVLWWIAGAHPRLLSHESCWLERPRYTASGVAVLVTVCCAALGAAGTLASVVPTLPAVLCAVGGLAWGGVILTIDRLLLLSLFKLESGKLGMPLWAVWLRVAGAVLVALCVSQTAEMTVFKRQLDVVVAVRQERDRADQRARLDARYREIPAVQGERARLLAETRTAHEDADRAADAAACEADGTCGSGRAGTKGIYGLKKQRADERQAVATATDARNAASIRELEGRLTTLTRARDAEFKRFDQVASAADDFLARRAALADLEADPVHGDAVWMTSLVLTLLSLFVELAPLVVKLTSAYGPYDAAYKAIQDGRSASWRVVGARSATRAATLIEQDAMLGASVLTASGEMLARSTANALDSDAAAEASVTLQRDIVDRVVRMARETANRVFDDTFADDVAEAARAHRRRADEEVVASEARRAFAFDDLDEAVRRASSDLNGADGTFH